jgi:tRNA (guanine37-N1)-methyltransferase
LKVPYIKINKDNAKEEIERLKAVGELLVGFKVRREGSWVHIPVRHSDEEGEFEEVRTAKMSHVGSFERISDFFVIKEREGWERVLEEIVEKQKPRAVFLDKGVEGPYRIRNMERVFGSGNPSGIHKENGFRYLVDLEVAYFSPRLSGLRRRITENCIENGKVGLVVDMYAGIGPISIPLSRKGIRILSVDMNEDAVKLLANNSKLNRAKCEALIADSNQIASCFRTADQVIMNNPTQSLSLSGHIISSFRKGAIVHFTHIQEQREKLEIGGVKILEMKEVHGYSPSSSLFYYMMLKR